MNSKYRAMMWQDLKLIFTFPTEFFRSVEKEKGIKKPFIYFFLASVVSILASLLILALSGILADANPAVLAQQIVLGLISSLAFTFIWALPLFAVTRVAKINTKFDKIYQIFAYSQIPYILTRTLPFISAATAIYGLILIVVGMRIFYKIKTLKAVLILVLTLCVLVLASIALITARLNIPALNSI
jgi:hypothetical protein